MNDGIDFPGYDRAPEAARLPVLRFDAKRAEWREAAPADDFPAERLTVATFNTWFQGGERGLRYAGVLRELERCAPDAILLQEATVELVDALQAAAWVRRGYALVRAPFRADAIPSHGVAVLVRPPVEQAVLHPLKTYMGRRLLSVRCRVNAGPMVFATAHLESMKGYAEVRGEQLRTIFALLEDAPEVVFGGDFNFCSSWTAENARIDARYVDVWPALRPGEPGYTQDTDRNPMLAAAKKDAKKVRFDRLLLRSASGRWKPDAVQLLGVEPVSPRHPQVFPSDHFGVCAAFRRK